MKGHEFKAFSLPRTADVPFNRRWRALKGDVMTDAIGLSLNLPSHDLTDRFHPLTHGFTWKTFTHKNIIQHINLRVKIFYVCKHAFEQVSWSECIWMPRVRYWVQGLSQCECTSKLCGAGEVCFKSAAEFSIILKIIKVMFHPLTEHI